MIFDIKQCHIDIGRKSKATKLWFDWEDYNTIKWTKYSIKETDMRVKTATFTSPYFIDLTTGLYTVRIRSIYHENFAGVVLSAEYDENSGLYTYQCQDFSRTYISKFEFSLNGKTTIYTALRWLLTKGRIGTTNKPFSSEQLDEFSTVLSGLKPKWRYDQSLYHNIVSGKPMDNKPVLLIRDKSFMETIRALTIGTMRYVDLWFNDNGVLQITPLDREDWMNTGLLLNADSIMSRKFKFDTTNAITGVIVNGEGLTGGQGLTSEKLLNLNLDAFFGNVTTSVKGSTTTQTTKTTTTKTTTTNTNKVSSTSNPFNNKKKKIMVSVDGGSNSFKNKIVNLLKKDGWTVTDLGVGAGTHSQSYRQIDSSYAVNLVIFNGFCPGTVRECYTGWLKGHHEKKGVTLVNMWDTSSWTSGMKPYRNGDFSGYSAKRAWDDNFSSGDPSIKNVADYLKKYNVKYCCGTTPERAMEQFRAGGYFNYISGKNTSNKSTSTKNNTTSTSNTVLVTKNDQLINNAEATKKIGEHSRDYFSVDITLPLGNTELKNVHTNQWLFTYLPPEFELANWTLIAGVLSSQYNRYSGADYDINRWYIESNNIDVDTSGNAKMSLKLNAFATSTTSYGEDYRSMAKAYNDAKSKGNSKSSNGGSGSSAGKTTTNAVATSSNSLINDKWVKKYNIPSIVVDRVKKACKGKTTDKDKAYAWYKWMDNNVGYAKYWGHERTPEQVIKRKSGNCVDNSRVYRLGCLAMGLSCKFVHGKSCCSGGECANHQWNKVKIGNKWQTVDCGRSYASWGSHWGNCSGGISDSNKSW